MRTGWEICVASESLIKPPEAISQANKRIEVFLETMINSMKGSGCIDCRE
jgi:hypothetical protein